MRISPVSYFTARNLKTTKNISSTKERYVYNLPYQNKAAFLLPFNISFGSRVNVPNDNARVYTEAVKLLDDLVENSRYEAKADIPKQAADKKEPLLLDFSKYPLSQRLIFQKYANSQHLKELLEIQSATMTKSEIAQSLLNKEVALTRKFNQDTYEKFTSPNSNQEERLEAFALSLAFLSLAIKNSDSKKLSEILTAIANFKNAVEISSFQDNSQALVESTKRLFDLSCEYWKKEYLPPIIDEEIGKIIFIENAASKHKTLQDLKVFRELPLDEKYFVAQYFENQNGIVYSDDPMLEILQNRTIPDISSIISEMRKKASIDNDDFLSKINNLNGLLKTPQGVTELSCYYVGDKNLENSISLLTLLLLIMNKPELIEEQDFDKIADSFKDVPEEEVTGAAELIKQEWQNSYLPAIIDKEAMFKAHETDANTQIIKELKQINENLGKIVIRLDDISISLNQLVTNMDRLYAKFDNPQEKTKELSQAGALYIEAMKDGMANLTPEQSKQLLNAFKTEGVRYLDVLSDKTSDPESKKMINGLKQTIYKANNPSTVVARLENYAPILLLNQGITMGRKAITHSAFSRAKEEFMCKGMQEEAAKQMASRKIAEEGAALSAGAITGLTIAAVAAIGLYGIYKASNVHKQFSDLYFGE